MILAAVDGINWEEVGESIADFILGIDWAGVAARLWIIGQDLSFGILVSVIGLSKWAKYEKLIQEFKALQKEYERNMENAFMKAYKALCR